MILCQKYFPTKIRKAKGLCHFICFKVLRKKNALWAQRGQLNEMRKVIRVSMWPIWKNMSLKRLREEFFMSLRRLNDTLSKKGKKVFLACSILEWYVNEMLTRVVLRRIRNVHLFKGLRTSRFRNAFKCSKKVSYVWHMHALYEWVMFARKKRTPGTSKHVNVKNIRFQSVQAL